MTKDFGKSDWLYQSRIAPNLKEKIKCLEHVLLIDPDDGDVWFDLGDIHYENSNDKANYCWKIATKCYAKRLERFKEDAIKYRKNSNHLLFMDVSSANILDEISSKMFSLASAYYNLDKYSLSAQYYLKSCEINSKSIDSLYYASRAFYELEQFDDAIKYVKQYLSLIHI